MTSPQQRAEESVARAFGRSPTRPVTEADQHTARAFGRTVPEITETATPQDELTALLSEFRSLRVSRMGESATAAAAQASLMRTRVVDQIDGTVRYPSKLRPLREAVEELRAQVPLSAGDESATDAPSVDEAVAAAFGRTTKGQE